MHRGDRPFLTLDALRGIAALGVMGYHQPGWLPGGYLAVDLFFILSGFVIAHAYHRQMAAGMGPRAFLWRRAVRLWPCLALGAMLGMVLHGGHAGALLLLPDWRGTGLFPANPPLWSLLLEAFAYAAFACGGWRLGPRALGVIAGACALGLAWLVLGISAPLQDAGAFWHSLGGGLLRLGFGFSAGMWLWHAWHARPRTRRSSPLGWLLLAGLALPLALIPAQAGGLALLAAFVLFPALVWLALCWELPQARVAGWLGALSYPLYCIHMPLLAWAKGNAMAVVAMLLALPWLALALERWLERPARAWLAARLLDRGNHLPPAAASASSSAP